MPVKIKSERLPLIEPIRPVRLPEPFDHPDWIFELKHDGFRAVAYVSNGECVLVSRTNYRYKSFTRLCSAIPKQLAVANAVLDGEIVTLDDDGRSQFKELLYRRGEPLFYAFDLLWLNGRDLRHLPQLERKRQLRLIVRKQSNARVLFADYIDGRGADFYRVVCETDLEGIVAKHKQEPYSSTARWFKIKNPKYSQLEGRDELFERRKQSTKD